MDSLGDLAILSSVSGKHFSDQGAKSCSRLKGEQHMVWG